jgi:hypothetical protein
MSKSLALRRAVTQIPLAPPGFRWASQKTLIRRLFSTLAALTLTGLLLVCRLDAGPPSLGNVLIVAGTDGLAQVAAGVLNTDLTGEGFTATIVDTGVPASLAGFSQIYDVRYDNHPAFTAGEMAQYLAFLNAAPGNALFLMGENVGFNVRNTPINQFIALAGGGTIAAPVTTSFNVETVNPPFTGPDPITTVKFAACGRVTSSGTGGFASSEAGGGCSLFFQQGTLLNAPRGALVVVYDVNFIATAPTFGAVNEAFFRINLEQFVSAPPGAPPTPSTTATATPSLTAWGMILLTGALLLLAIKAMPRNAVRGIGIPVDRNVD